MKITPKTLRQLMAIFSINDLLGRRHAIIWQFTKNRPSGGIESAKELTELEAQEIISYYNAKSNSMRRKMMAIASKMNWGSSTAEIIRALDQWCLTRTGSKKEFNRMSISELATALTILETKVYQEHLKSL